jgi:hypothetical protein
VFADVVVLIAQQRQELGEVNLGELPRPAHRVTAPVVTGRR